jgi:hypothetical protein
MPKEVRLPPIENLVMIAGHYNKKNGIKLKTPCAPIGVKNRIREEKKNEYLMLLISNVPHPISHIDLVKITNLYNYKYNSMIKLESMRTKIYRQCKRRGVNVSIERS